MLESLSQFGFILMVFTPFIAVPIFCFFVGWMIPRSQITEKSIMAVLSFVLFCLVLISYYAPQLLGMFFGVLSGSLLASYVLKIIASHSSG